MNLRRLLIFLPCSACAFLLSLFGQQLRASGPTVLIVLPTSDPGQLAGWEHYRDPVRKLGYHLAVRTGEHPRVEISDPRGGVIAKYAGDSPAAFLVQSLRLPAALSRSEVRGKRLELTLSARREPAPFRQRIVLVADLQLQPGVHVYAPGVEGYIPIAWTLQPSPEWTVRNVVYPEPETLHLPAIDETVPAYRDHFRLTREIVVTSPQSGAVSLQGALRYQACDDTMCYIPETLPMRWEIDPEPVRGAKE